MSIRDEINNRCNENPPRLILLQPAILGSKCVRTLFVSPEINNALLGPWENVEQEHRCGQLGAYLDRFIEGALISVGKRPFKKRADAFLVRIHEADSEVWEIRVREPSPGIRIFGRFSEQDHFIALTWLNREVLDDSKDWRDARERCKAEWRKLFPTYEPLKGANFYDYATNIVLV